jgi:outer membrane protein OmpA-like peptidoglycan-associated protein
MVSTTTDFNFIPKGNFVNKLNMNAIAFAVGLALGAPSMAAELSAAEYAAAEKTISADFTTAKAACESLSGNANDICLAQAKGTEAVAKADLNVKNEPTPDMRLQAQVARAEAEFAVAKERCDDLSGTAKTTCVNTATTAETAAKAKADADMQAAMTKVQVAPKSSATVGKNELRATDTLFDFDSADIRPAGRASLDDFIGKLKADSSAQISVAGYADRLGTAAYNQLLSEERMEAVKSYLVDKGIQTSRITAEAMGQAQPTMSANDCSGERSAAVIACLQPDRRVVVSTTELVSSR